MMDKQPSEQSAFFASVFTIVIATSVAFILLKGLMEPGRFSSSDAAWIMGLIAGSLATKAWPVVVWLLSDE